jgi:hypothetical protein
MVYETTVPDKLPATLLNKLKATKVSPQPTYHQPKLYESVCTLMEPLDKFVREVYNNSLDKYQSELGKYQALLSSRRVDGKCQYKEPPPPPPMPRSFEELHKMAVAKTEEWITLSKENVATSKRLIAERIEKDKASAIQAQEWLEKKKEEDAAKKVFEQQKALAEAEAKAKAEAERRNPTFRVSCLNPAKRRPKQQRPTVLDDSDSSVSDADASPDEKKPAAVSTPSNKE